MRVCTWSPSCGRRVSHKNGLCQMHHYRAQKGLPMDAPAGLKSGPKPSGPCVEPDCDRPARALGFCTMHRARQRAAERPPAPPRPRKWTTDNCYTVADSGCWEWRGPQNPMGYGTHPQALAHRWMYAELVGPIPDGLTIDHLCRNTICVNPAHLEPVTMAENNRRATLARQAERPTCIRGHEYTSENTYVAPGTLRRSCRTCHRDYQREFKRRRRAVAA